MGTTFNQMPTEKPNTQQPIAIPSPRISPEGQTPSAPEPEQDIVLFTTEVNETSYKTAEAFLAGLPSDTPMPATTIVQQLLERFGTIPTEIAAEDVDKRAQAITKIGKLAFDDASFKDVHDTVDTQRFNDEVILATGREVISTYPIAQLLLDAIKKSRAKGDKSIESYKTEQLMAARRIALLGIARQLETYPPKASTKQA